MLTLTYNDMNSEPTQEPISERNANCTNNDCGSTNQSMDKDDSHAEHGMLSQ